MNDSNSQKGEDSLRRLKVELLTWSRLLLSDALTLNLAVLPGKQPDVHDLSVINTSCTRLGDNLKSVRCGSLCEAGLKLPFPTVTQTIEGERLVNR